MPAGVSAFILVLLVLAAACKRHPEVALSPDEAIRKKLEGVWVGEHKYSSGSEITEKMELAADGSSVEAIFLPKRKIGPHTIEQKGTWQVQQGVFIENVTNDSQTNARVPNVSRLRIARINEHELEFEVDEKIEGVNYPTNQLIYKKQTQ